MGLCYFLTPILIPRRRAQPVPRAHIAYTKITYKQALILTSTHSSPLLPLHTHPLSHIKQCASSLPQFSSSLPSSALLSLPRLVAPYSSRPRPVLIYKKFDGPARVDNQNLADPARVDNQNFEDPARVDYQNFEDPTQADRKRFESAGHADYKRFESAGHADYKRFESAGHADY